MKNELGFVPDDLTRFRSLHEQYLATVDPIKHKLNTDLKVKFAGNQKLPLAEGEHFTYYTVEEQLLARTVMPQKTTSQLGPNSKKLLDKLKSGSFPRNPSQAVFTKIAYNYTGTLETLNHVMRIQHYLYHIIGDTSASKTLHQRVTNFKKGYECARTFCDQLHKDTLKQLDNVTANSTSSKASKAKCKLDFLETQQKFPLTIPKEVGSTKAERQVIPLTERDLTPLFKRALSSKENSLTAKTKVSGELVKLKKALKQGPIFFESAHGADQLRNFQWSKSWFNPNKRSSAAANLNNPNSKRGRGRNNDKKNGRGGNKGGRNKRPLFPPKLPRQTVDFSKPWGVSFAETHLGDPKPVSQTPLVTTNAPLSAATFSSEMELDMSYLNLNTNDSLLEDKISFVPTDSFYQELT